MNGIRDSTCLRSFLLPLAATLWIGTVSCTSVQPVAEPLAATLEADPPEEVWIELVGGERFKLRSPRVVSDSLEGLLREGEYRDDVRRVRYPLSEIAAVETQRSDIARSAGTAALILLGALLVAGIVDKASGGGF
jgi:hypothetical protein